MPYYPQQTLILGLATLRRERRLPPGAIGEVMVKDNQRVDPSDVVLRGAVSGKFIILDVVEALGLRNADQLTEEMFQVPAGDLVEKGQVIAVRGRRSLKAPVDAVVARIEGTQVILQANPQPVEIRAMCPGEITSIRGTNEVLIETIGALIQCAWGNDKWTFSAYKMEPSGGLESLEGDNLLPEYRSQGIVMTHPIQSSALFTAAVQQGVTAIIAPSMHADLREAALRQTIPVILTEGFGEQQMSELVYNLLRDNLGRQALIDATEPARWTSTRPEILIPLPSGGSAPATPEADQYLVEGAIVRLARAPYTGMAGRVRRIIELPRPVENGLRLAGAEVQLAGGRTVFVPLANIEMLGRAVDAPGTGDA